MVVRRWPVLAFVALFGAVGCGKEPLKGVVPEEALSRLLEGNKRYVAAKAAHPNQTVECRTRIAGAQSPFAIVLGCSDSRVPPEVVFDQGLGDLFVVRSAGQVLDEAGLGSLEYGAEHLDVHLIVVLGHERCGAVDAVVRGVKVEGHIEGLLKAIRPAVEAAKGKPGEPLDEAVKANVALVTKTLRSSKPILKELIENGKLKIVGARYDLDSGVVQVIEP